jgi:hypothetical protein
MPRLPTFELRTLSAMFFRISTVPVLLLILTQASVMAVSPVCSEGGIVRCCEKVRNNLYREWHPLTGS